MHLGLETQAAKMIRLERIWQETSKMLKSFIAWQEKQAEHEEREYLDALEEYVSFERKQAHGE